MANHVDAGLDDLADVERGAFGSPTQVTLEQASLACVLGGWRLCTEDEWRTACMGPAETRFPYGNDFNGRACNSAGFGPGEVLPAGSLDETCVSGYGASDMSGNVKEWTGTAAADDDTVHLLLGGAYDNRLENSLACDGLAIPRQDDFRFNNLGFRCCKGVL